MDRETARLWKDRLRAAAKPALGLPLCARRSATTPITGAWAPAFWLLEPLP